MVHFEQTHRPDRLTLSVEPKEIPALIGSGIQGLTFHDLRGSAVDRLALANATVPQIATFTGHALKDVEAILDKHYLGRNVRLAEDAVRKLERKEKRTKTVKGL